MGVNDPYFLSALTEADDMRETAFATVETGLKRGELDLCAAVRRLRIAYWKAWRDVEAPLYQKENERTR
jgi:hypothetical protein